MGTKLNKFISIMKKNYSVIIMATIALVLLFVPEAKAFVQQGFMKIGLFQPKLEKIESAPENNEEGEELPEANYAFEMIDEKGNKVDMQALKGKVVFINFWATWCPPCIAEMPSLQVLYDKIKDDPEIEFITIEVEGIRKQDKVAKFMERKNLSLPVMYPNSGIPSDFFQGSLPTTIILDKKGNIAHTTLGMADYSGDDIVNFLHEIKAMH